MAIYQVTIFFIPKHWLVSSGQIQDLHNEEGFFDGSELWENSDQNGFVKELLNKEFGTDNQTFWKIKSQNDLSIEENESGVVESVRARIDGRNYDSDYLKQVLKLAADIESVKCLWKSKKYLK